MTTATYLRAADGAIVPEAEATRDGVVRSGYALRTGVQIIDGALRTLLRDGGGLEEMRGRMRDQREARLTNDWKNPPAYTPDASTSSAAQEPPRIATDSYATRDHRLANNWRNA